MEVELRLLDEKKRREFGARNLLDEVEQINTNVIYTTPSVFSVISNRGRIIPLGGNVYLKRASDATDMISKVWVAEDPVETYSKQIRTSSPKAQQTKRVIQTPIFWVPPNTWSLLAKEQKTNSFYCTCVIIPEEIGLPTWKRITLQPSDTDKLINDKHVPSIAYCKHVLSLRNGIKNKSKVDLMLKDGSFCEFIVDCEPLPFQNDTLISQYHFPETINEWGIVKDNTIFSITFPTLGNLPLLQKPHIVDMDTFDDNWKRIWDVMYHISNSESSSKILSKVISNKIMVVGPSGTGKTSVVLSLAHRLKDAKLIPADASSVLSKFPAGQEDKSIESYFELAKSSITPSILLFDNIDIIFPSNESSKLERSNMMYRFISLLNDLPVNVLLIGVASDIKHIHPVIAKRFESIIQFDIPSLQKRKGILRQLGKNINFEPDVDLDEISNKCHGFVGADLKGLISIAISEAIKREPNKDKLKVSLDDMYHSIKIIKNTRSIGIVTNELTPMPKTLWSDIGGLSEVKQQLQESVIWSYKHADAFKRMGIKPPRGVLLYGPPGTGKTLLAQAVATESDANFLSVRLTDILRSYVGESERKVADLFKKASTISPCILFFDEIDALFANRGSAGHGERKIVSQFLVEMNGIESKEGIIVLATTSSPELIDKSFFVPGRFDRIVYVAPPDEIARKEIWEINLKRIKPYGSIDIDKLVTSTSFFTGADIRSVCNKAGLRALEQGEINNVKGITNEDLIESINEFKPSLNSSIIDRYKNWWLQIK